MSTNAVNDIINRTRAAVAEKRASFDTRIKSAMAGKDPSSYPGAEHDSPDDQDKKTDPEVGDWLPSGVHDTSGAGDNNPLTFGHVTDSTQSPPEAGNGKPLVTADANAKTAAQSTDLLNRIREYQLGKVATAAPAASKTRTPAPKVPTADREKVATGFNLQLTQDVLAKMAAYALATEEGVQFMEAMLSKQAGAAAAAEMLDFITDQNDTLDKQAAFQQGAEDTELLLADYGEKQAAFDAGGDAAEQLLSTYAQQVNAQRSGRVNTVGAAIKTALHKKGKDDLTQAYYKLGQDVADASIDAGLGGELMEDPDPEMMPPAMVPGQEGEEDMGEFGEEGGEEEGEELLAALEQLLADGTIDESDLEEILSTLMAGGADGDEGYEGDEDGYMDQEGMDPEGALGGVMGGDGAEALGAMGDSGTSDAGELGDEAKLASVHRAASAIRAHLTGKGV